VVLYDGSCRFCCDRARSVRRLAGERVDVRPWQAAIEELPGEAVDRARTALTLVRPDGTSVAGAEAIVELLRIARPVLGLLASLYYLPGVRQLADRAYRLVATRRYALRGSAPAHVSCAHGACEAPTGDGRPHNTSTGHRAATRVRSKTPPSSDSSQRE
jgi:predicted DCC family thiol-disulfide oxidoreductase YuxK